MHLQLITIEGVSVDTPIYELIAPTTAGEIAVFPGHESIVTMAEPGALAVRYNKTDKDSELDYFAISGGVIEINPDSIRVLVDEAAHGDDITEADSKEALERALKLRGEAKSQVEIEQAREQIGLSAGRLRVAELHRRRRNRP